MISGLTYLWDIRYTDITIKRRHTKPYEHTIRSNKVELSTATGTYFMPHDVKVPFCMPYFSIRNIRLNLFHVDNNEGESGIGNDMIIGRGLMLQLGLSPELKRQLLQRYDITVPLVPWLATTVTSKHTATCPRL